MDMTCPLDNPDPVARASRAYSVALLAVNAAVCLLILGGNALTLSALLHQRWYRKETLCPRFKVSSLFVMNLAVADFLIGCAILFFLVTHYVCSLSELLSRNKFLCLLKTAVFVFTASISITTIAAISIDRYVAVIHSLHYPEYMTRRRALLIITGTWIVGSLTGFSLFFWNRFEPGQPCLENVVPERHMELIGLPLHAVVFLVIVVVHLRIRHEVSAMRQRRMQCKASIFGIELQNNSVKSVHALVLVIGCYLVCWLPWLTVMSLRLLGVTSPVLDIAFQCFFTLANMNAVLNPFIYSWKNASVRKALQQFMDKLVLLAKGGGDGGKPPPADRRTPSPQSSSSGLTVSSSLSNAPAAQPVPEHVEKYTPFVNMI